MCKSSQKILDCFFGANPLYGRFEASSSKNLRKGGQKLGVQLIVRLDAERVDVDVKRVEDMFKGVGKGLAGDQRVEVGFL